MMLKMNSNSLWIPTTIKDRIIQPNANKNNKAIYPSIPSKINLIIFGIYHTNTLCK